MSIKFVCSCGQHLKARDEQAGRLTVCPRCGEPVAVPTLRPAPRDAPPPWMPCEKRRFDPPSTAGADTPAATAAPPTLPKKSPPAGAGAPDPERAALAALVRDMKDPTKPRARRGPRPLETYWYQCLFFPLFEWRAWLGPAFVIALLLGGVAVLLPEMLASAQMAPLIQGLLWFVAAIGLVLAVGYPCTVLWCALADASAGGNSKVWRGYTLAAVLKSGLITLAACCAGPVAPAAGAFFFWLHAGELRWIDWFIVGELSVAAVGYLLLVLATVAERGWLRGVNPLRVADLAHRLGWRALVVVFLGALVVLGHGTLAVAGLLLLHKAALLGGLCLAACGLSGMYWSAFLFRVLGFWCYRTRTTEPREARTGKPAHA